MWEPAGRRVKGGQVGLPQIANSRFWEEGGEQRQCARHCKRCAERIFGRGCEGPWTTALAYAGLCVLLSSTDLSLS